MWNQQAPQRDESTQPQKTSAAAEIGRPADERRVVAWVGKSVLFKGHLVSREDLTIDGQVEGTVELADYRLIVGPDGHITADIVAKAVTVFGKVTGTITATGTVDIKETGSVEGDVTCGKLAVAEGAGLRGRIETARAERQSASRQLAAV